MEREIRHAFSDQLRDLERQVLDGFDLVSEQLTRVLEALRRRDAGLAGVVVAADRSIDRCYLHIHHETIALLANQAPVAGDLRLVAALLHVVWCLGGWAINARTSPSSCRSLDTSRRATSRCWRRSSAWASS